MPSIQGLCTAPTTTTPMCDVWQRRCKKQLARNVAQDRHTADRFAQTRAALILPLGQQTAMSSACLQALLSANSNSNSSSASDSVELHVLCRTWRMLVTRCMRHQLFFCGGKRGKEKRETNRPS